MRRRLVARYQSLEVAPRSLCGGPVVVHPGEPVSLLLLFRVAPAALLIHLLAGEAALLVLSLVVAAPDKGIELSLYNLTSSYVPSYTHIVSPLIVCIKYIKLREAAAKKSAA